MHTDLVNHDDEIAHRQTEEIGEAIADLEESAAAAVALLRQRDLDESIRAAGIKHFCEVIVETAADIGGEARRRPVTLDSRELWSGVAGRMQRAWRWSDARVRQLTETAVRVIPSLSARARRGFWVVGLTLSAAAALAIVTGNYEIAAVAVTVRWAGSLAAGGPAIAEGVPGLLAVWHHPSIRRHLLTSCVASHAADFILLGAISVGLLGVGRPGWAVATSLGGLLAAYASLSRVGAERRGARISRSVVERLVRNTSIGLAIGLAVVFGGQAAVYGIPGLAVAGAGFAFYAIFEIVRTAFSLIDSPPRATVSFVLTEGEEARITHFGDVATPQGEPYLEVVGGHAAAI